MTTTTPSHGLSVVSSSTSLSNHPPSASSLSNHPASAYVPPTPPIHPHYASYPPPPTFGLDNTLGFPYAPAHHPFYFGSFASAGMPTHLPHMPTPTPYPHISIRRFHIRLRVSYIYKLSIKRIPLCSYHSLLTFYFVLFCILLSKIAFS